jgi:hypothetical protein
MNKINVELNITDQEIKDIVITALEGGIGYWGCLINEGEDFDLFYKDQKGISTSEFVADLLLSGKSVYFYDSETKSNEGEPWELRLNMILNGIEMYIQETKKINFIDNLDSLVADIIFQYAMFNEIIYG